jgi:hypothetical protein
MITANKMAREISLSSKILSKLRKDKMGADLSLQSKPIDSSKFKSKNSCSSIFKEQTTINSSKLIGM